MNEEMVLVEYGWWRVNVWQLEELALLPALGAVALSATLGMYVRRFLIRTVGGDASPAVTSHERPHWHFPSSQELDRLARSLVESIPGPISPDISSAINARLSASI